ncbi:DUF2254 domain-containing protein [Streptantibioticus ferralitis]|uniref:DUF2254 domain-containing protein n=1 Tax=Streptantibioticus ferralitis TaxID=236510 RepID=A0ABT5YT10_9ACTN|nr:DUF2254 domain-containing protein [Streptantibioticus ferralitis]MDF2254734.1 DUF2254 domain-containing protein [Streptantibioticus ferralitis]
MIRRVHIESQWRREALRTNLWLVPTVEVALATGLFLGTWALDWAAYRGSLELPSWVISGTADAARQILAAIAAALITVVGVVFSIMIVTLTLASTQFGPRMLRTFIRDRTTQLTLGTFVATFVYAILALVAISPGPHGDFVPHLSITVCMALVLTDLAVLIYFIHHITTSIQLPHVIASIAADLSEAIETGAGEPEWAGGVERGPSAAELHARLDDCGGPVLAPASGYLQFVRHRTLVHIATELQAVIRLENRPGHFLVQGHQLATVWPPEAAPEVARTFAQAHITGPARTLTQDIAFAVDQLVEIAIRALSPAVNDTFTALTCIDWLGEGLCRIAARWQPNPVHRDEAGYIRVMAVPVGYERLVQRAFEKIRQAGRGMPAILIRQLDALAEIMTETTSPEQRQVLVSQAEMIERVSTESVPEQADREDVHRRYLAVLTLNASVGNES